MAAGGCGTFSFLHAFCMLLLLYSKRHLGTIDQCQTRSYQQCSATSGQTWHSVCWGTNTCDKREGTALKRTHIRANTPCKWCGHVGHVCWASNTCAMTCFSGFQQGWEANRPCNQQSHHNVFPPPEVLAATTTLHYPNHTHTVMQCGSPPPSPPPRCPCPPRFRCCGPG